MKARNLVSFSTLLLLLLLFLVMNVLKWKNINSKPRKFALLKAKHAHPETRGGETRDARSRRSSKGLTSKLHKENEE